MNHRSMRLKEIPWQKTAFIKMMRAMGTNGQMTIIGKSKLDKSPDQVIGGGSDG